MRLEDRKGNKWTGSIVNSEGIEGKDAWGKRATWVDVGMEIEGRDDLGHIAIFDHSSNNGFPQTWRVDGQLGVGPSRAVMGDWKIKQGQPETIRHRLVAYTGDLNDLELTELWRSYVNNEEDYSTAALWRIANEESYKEKFLTPAEAVERMTRYAKSHGIDFWENSKPRAWKRPIWSTRPIPAARRWARHPTSSRG